MRSLGVPEERRKAPGRGPGGAIEKNGSHSASRCYAFSHCGPNFSRHGRACPGHPRYAAGRDEPSPRSFTTDNGNTLHCLALAPTRGRSTARSRGWPGLKSPTGLARTSHGRRATGAPALKAGNGSGNGAARIEIAQNELGDPPARSRGGKVIRGEIPVSQTTCVPPITAYAAGSCMDPFRRRVRSVDECNRRGCVYRYALHCRCALRSCQTLCR